MPGFADGFGDRLLMFDNSDSDTGSLELLRFNPALADAPGFEDALRARVLQLRGFSHDAFPAVRAVKRLEAEGTLALVSTHAPGKPLSSFFTEARSRRGLNPAFVTWVLARAIQPLSILQSEGDNIAHGALNADRLILAPGGRLSISEYVLGPALAQLRLPATRLWSEFGLVMPPPTNTESTPDARSDVFQLAVLALSMLLSRRITPLDLNEGIASLLDECSDLSRAESPRSGDPLRLWLERALQIGSQSYGSAADALADLRELPSHTEARALEYMRSPGTNGLVSVKSVSLPQQTAQPNEQEEQMANRALKEDAKFRDSAEPQAPTLRAADFDVSDSVDAFPLESVSESRAVRFTAFSELKSADAERKHSSGPDTKPRSISKWIAVALGMLAAAEAVVIAMLLLKPAAVTAGTNGGSVSQQADTVSAAPAASAATPAVERADAGTENAAALANLPTAPGLEANAAALALAATRQRSGGVRLVAPVELKVLEGERVLGSSADGPIVASAGVHQLDLINTVLGFRSRSAVTFRAGEISSLTIAVPNGRLSVNAQPWAAVWVDGRALGETPLANIEIPIGEHELIFRHPQLGERRQTITVRADTPTRVGTAFDGDATSR